MYLYGGTRVAANGTITRLNSRVGFSSDGPASQPDWWLGTRRVELVHNLPPHILLYTLVSVLNIFHVIHGSCRLAKHWSTVVHRGWGCSHKMVWRPVNKISVALTYCMEVAGQFLSEQDLKEMRTLAGPTFRSLTRWPISSGSTRSVGKHQTK